MGVRHAVCSGCGKPIGRMQPRAWLSFSSVTYGGGPRRAKTTTTATYCAECAAGAEMAVRKTLKLGWLGELRDEGMIGDERD